MCSDSPWGPDILIVHLFIVRICCTHFYPLLYMRAAAPGRQTSFREAESFTADCSLGRFALLMPTVGLWRHSLIVRFSPRPPVSVPRTHVCSSAQMGAPEEILFCT